MKIKIRIIHNMLRLINCCCILCICLERPKQPGVDFPVTAQSAGCVQLYTLYTILYIVHIVYNEAAAKQPGVDNPLSRQLRQLTSM